MSSPRIYVDESGTEVESKWLLIGALFVLDHGPLHTDLCAVKTARGYLNKNPKRKARFKESHFAEFNSQRDVDVFASWVDVFLRHQCYFRSIVVDWSVWDGRYFGDPFEPDALKKRRAYKKWAEMLLHPEVKELRNAILYLDRLRICYGYEVLSELKDRFIPVSYMGSAPYVREFRPAASWKDANQALQLADCLLGCVRQKLVPSSNRAKLAATDVLYTKLQSVGVKKREASYWRGFDPKTLTKHFPKFSEWYWKPTK